MTIINLSYVGCLISPRDFKKQIENSHISLNTSEEGKNIAGYCDLVHEVLYKFSYNKLSMFINISGFETLFRYFYKAYVNDSDDCSTKKYSDIVLSYIHH